MELSLLLFVVPTPFAFAQDPREKARELIQKLGSDKVEEREEAAKQLFEMGLTAQTKQDVRDGLNDALKRSGDAEVRSRAEQILRRLKLRDRIPQGLLEKAPWVEGMFEEGETFEAWERARRDELNLTEEQWTALAAEALKGDPEDAKGKRRVIEFIMEYELRGCAAGLTALLKYKNEDVRQEAAWALGSLRAKEFAPKVAELLKDKNGNLRREAAVALGKIQAKEFVPRLAELLKDENDYVRSGAIRSLGDLQAKEYAPKFAALLKYKDHFVRMEAASALAKFQAKEYAPQLAELLMGPHELSRWAAAAALGKLQAKEYFKDVVSMLKDPKGDVRAWAAISLVELGGCDSVPKNEELLRKIQDVLFWDQEYAVRARAALRELGVKEEESGTKDK